jgi:hypothetical protein
MLDGLMAMVTAALILAQFVEETDESCIFFTQPFCKGF